MPVRPVAKQRAMCTALGEAATFDLYLLNDTDRAATGTLTFSAVTPSGKLLKFGEWPAPEWKRDQFSYLVKEAFVTPKLDRRGDVEVQVCDFVRAAGVRRRRRYG